MAAEHNTHIKSRVEYQKNRIIEKKKELENKSHIRTKKRIRIRLIPIWLRIVILAILLTVSACIGVIVGYGVIGDGDVEDALKISTWQHIIDLVEKKK